MSIVTKQLCSANAFGVSLSLQACEYINLALIVVGTLLALMFAIKYPALSFQLLIWPAKSLAKLLRHLFKKHRHYYFYEENGYCHEHTTLFRGMTIAYPRHRWIRKHLGGRSVKRSALKVRFPKGVRSKELIRDLELWSAEFSVKFTSISLQGDDLRTVIFHTSLLPLAVDERDLPSPMSPFSLFFGISENAEVISVDLTATPAGAVYAGSGHGKSSWLASILHSIAPGLTNIVVVTTKQLSLYKSVPGAIVIDAFAPSDLIVLRNLLQKLRETAKELTSLLDKHSIETIEDLYRSGISTPEIHPRWLFVLDEAKDYLKPVRRNLKDRPLDDIEEAHQDLVQALGDWMRKYRFLSRHVIVAAQSGAASDLDLEISNFGYKVLGPQRPAMAQALVSDLRPATEPMPKGTFFFCQGNALTHFRGLYTPSRFGPRNGHDG